MTNYLPRAKIPAVVAPSRAARDVLRQQMVKSFMSEPEQLLRIDHAQVANLSQTEVQFVQAELVRMHFAAAEAITADEVELDRSAVGNLKAARVDAQMSALGTVSTGEVSTERSALGYVQAQNATVGGYIGAVVGTNVHAEGARTLLLVGRNVTGSVTTLLDARSALIAGLTGGLVFLVGRLLFGRK